MAGIMTLLPMGSSYQCDPCCRAPQMFVAVMATEHLSDIMMSAVSAVYGAIPLFHETGAGLT